MEVKLSDDVEKFIRSLDKKTVAKALRTIDLLEQFGSRLSMPHSKKVNTKLFELRVRGKREVRIFYTFKQKKAFLIHGFVKKSQKTPQKEMRAAKKKMQLL